MLYFTIICTCQAFCGCSSASRVAVLQNENDSLRQIISAHNCNEYLTGAVLWNIHSPEYTALCLQIFGNAKEVLRKNIAQFGDNSKKPAVVTDIDETVLQNSLFDGWLCRTGTPFDLDDWDKWCLTEQATAVPGAAEFLNFASGLGCEIFYVSNRCGDDVKKATMNNLKNTGFPNVDDRHVFFKTTGDETISKADRRNMIETQFGCEIVMLLGDQVADFDSTFDLNKNLTEKDIKSRVVENAEKFGSKFILLPNPQYSNWNEMLTRKDRLKALGSFTIKK